MGKNIWYKWIFLCGLLLPLLNMTCVTRRCLQRQKDFILDGVAVDTISSSYTHILPKLWSALPPYNAQLDIHAANYFASPSVKALLKKTEQVSASGGNQTRAYCNGDGWNSLARQLARILFLIDWTAGSPVSLFGLANVTLLFQQLFF